MSNSNDQGVRSVQLALDVLEAVAFSGGDLGVTQIANRVGLTKGSVSRHLHTLVERGYLVQDPSTARYVLGPRGHLIGRLAPPGTDIAAAAGSAMRELRDTVGLTIVLSTPSSKGAMVLTALPGTTAIEIGVRPGSELAYHASAQGKALLAFGREALLQRILGQKLEPLTKHTQVDPKALSAEVLRIREDGFAVAPEEALLGINALAAPVFDGQGVCVAAVAIVSSIQYVPADPPGDMIEAVFRAAETISRNLGGMTANRHPPQRRQRKNRPHATA
jgi:IclR family transcriptional regulator, KDG regulon repressor